MAGVASLAFGLGSGLAIFTVMNALMFRPLPGRGTANLQKIFTSDSSGKTFGASSYADFRSFIETPGLFSATCATTTAKGNIASDGQTHAIRGALVSGGCFGIIQLRAHLGRLIGAADDPADGGPIPIVITHALWRRTFAANPDIVGHGVLLNGMSAVVVGVSEAGFSGLSLDAGAGFFAPVRLAPALLSPETLTARGQRRFTGYARLAEGVSSAQAMERLTMVAARLRTEDPDAWIDESGATRRVTIAPEIESRFATGGGPEIALLTIGAIAGVVALACVNLATMLVARGASRTRELGIRLSLGASRMRLLRQLATESLLISIGGTIVGGGAVVTALRLFDIYRPAQVPAVNLGLDWRVASCALLMAVAAPIIFGVAPGAHALRLAIADTLRNRPALHRNRFVRAGPREILIVVQIAVSFALLMSATLLMQSLRAAPPMVNAAAEDLLIVSVDLDAAARTGEEAIELSGRMLAAAERIPDVRASLAAIVPMTGSYMTMAGRPDERPQESATLDANVVSAGYFDLLGIQRRLGRDFGPGDTGGSARVVIVSESLARKLWQTTGVLGRSIHVDDHPREVVGVVADVPYRSPSAPSHPVVYLPQTQTPLTRFVVHARVGQLDGTSALSRELRSVDARITIDAPTTLGSRYEMTRMPGRIAEGIAGVAGMLQLALALMATWGLVTYAIERRSSEIAIRRALGATESRILQFVMRPSLWLFATGGTIGCGAGVMAANVLHSAFLGLAPINPIAVVPVAALLGLIVVVAAWVPARRAIAIQPAMLLRQQ